MTMFFAPLNPFLLNVTSYIRLILYYYSCSISFFTLLSMNNTTVSHLTVTTYTAQGISLLLGYQNNKIKWMVFYAEILHCKAMLGRVQPRLTRWNFGMKHAPDAGSILPPCYDWTSIILTPSQWDTSLYQNFIPTTTGHIIMNFSLYLQRDPVFDEQPNLDIHGVEVLLQCLVRADLCHYLPA